MTSIRKAKRQVLRWDRYTWNIRANWSNRDEGRHHPEGCCRAQFRWARAQFKWQVKHPTPSQRAWLEEAEKVWLIPT
jgi:hypothetical protein